MLSDTPSGEFKRRLVHASGTGLPLLHVLDIVTWREFGLVTLACSAVAPALAFLRLVVGIESSVYHALTRQYAPEHVAGYSSYMFSNTAVVLTVAQHVVVTAVLVLTIADHSP